ncbi:MAG: riboflavin biosynthesis protein RibF [Omnitrophica bacterium RIFCSPLOWO2_12_FULL_50_11]|nr:MAG: riboflavin biosynthesis protein RibF [Omnitrophica bacterium RIFCSPLOWO2_12_FULL_50_11]
MKIITDLSKISKGLYPDLVIGLGNFDGLHLAHQTILALIRERAKRLGGVSAVFTFREHPQRVLHTRENRPILTSVVHKLYLLKQSGIDLCFLAEFTVPFSRKSPEDFIVDVFVRQLGAKEICLGFNSRFGHERRGDSALMRRLAEKHHFTFVEGPPVRVGDRVVSSSKIRSCVKAGKLDEASKLLGRSYSFLGTVVPGSGRGERLGFPTANLDPASEVLPPQGVYAAWIRIWDCRLVESESGISSLEGSVTGKFLKAIMNYGRRPTFGKDSKAIPEVYILDYHEDLSQRTVEVIVGKRLREERTFRDERALKEQIKTDIESGQKWLAQQS